MKKKSIITLSIILLVVIGLGAVVMDKTHESNDQFLFKAGFKNIPALTGSNDANYWKNHYNLRYFSFEDMNKLMAANGFIVGQASAYTGIVPKEAEAEMRENYERVKADLPRYLVYMDNPSNTPISRFKIGDLTWKARRYLPTFNSHNWSGGTREATLDEFIHKDVLMNRGLDPNTQNFLLAKDYQYEKIYVIGHHSKFDTANIKTGADLAAIPLSPRNRDPLAVVKTERGWVILASWE